MKHSKINFTKLLKGYQKGWVAISRDHKRVVAFNKNLQELMKKTKKTKKEIYYFPSGESYSNFVD